MIIKVVRLEIGYIVHYASGRTRLFYANKLPDTVKAFMDNHEQTVERYGDNVAEIMWK